MSAVRRWNLFVRAALVAVGILVFGVGAFRVGVIEDERVALWPTFELLHLDRLQGQQPLSGLALIAAVQIMIWTLLTFLVFYGLDSVRHGSRRS
jgi:hypothetical protein